MSRKGQRQDSEVSKDLGYALRAAGLQAGLHNKANSWLLRRVIGRVLLSGRASSSTLSGASDWLCGQMGLLFWSLGLQAVPTIEQGPGHQYLGKAQARLWGWGSWGWALDLPRVTFHAALSLPGQRLDFTAGRTAGLCRAPEGSGSGPAADPSGVFSTHRCWLASCKGTEVGKHLRPHLDGIAFWIKYLDTRVHTGHALC